MDAAVRIPLLLSDIPASSGPLPIAQLNLGGVPRGAVILLCHEGALSGDAAERMNRLAEHGYESVAADLAASRADHPDGALVTDVGALLGRLAERGWTSEQIGLIGYGLGARAALLAAAEHTFGVAMSIGPAGLAGGVESLADLSGKLYTPWLGMFGVGTGGNQLAEAERVDTALRGSPAYTEVVSYRRVPDDFYLNPREWVTYAAAYDSFQRVIEWLDAHVVPRPTPLADLWRRRQLIADGSPA
jgi:carboxymethylenebutenolidase